MSTALTMQRLMTRVSRCLSHLQTGSSSSSSSICSVWCAKSSCSNMPSQTQQLRCKHAAAQARSSTDASSFTPAASHTHSHVAASTPSAHDSEPGVISTLPLEYSSNLPTSFNPLLASAGLPQDRLLFTPGPLTTSFSVKAACLNDLGSRDNQFIKVISEVQSELLDVAKVRADEFVVIPIQGSGTFGIEAVLCSAVGRSPVAAAPAATKSTASTSKKSTAKDSSANAASDASVPPHHGQQGGVLIVANGAYGLRQVAICKAHRIPYQLIDIPDYERPTVEAVDAALRTTASHCTHVSMVHSETTSGIINDLTPIGQCVAKHGKSFIIDAMSSFGGSTEIDFDAAHISYLISSSNKCIEGIPGFSFVIARRVALDKECKGNSSSLALDIESQSNQLALTKQFRFTPPTHAMLAFRQALRELKVEGGVHARQKRYKRNQSVLLQGLDRLGFKLYLPPTVQGHIISSFHWPQDSNWNFERFYSELSNKGFVIYPGKVSKADCFRIGHIGRIFPNDTQRLVHTIDQVCQQMKTAKYAKQ